MTVGCSHSRHHQGEPVYNIQSRSRADQQRCCSELCWVHTAFSLLAGAALALSGTPALQSCSCSWSKSSLELMLTWPPEATVLAVEAAVCCPVGSCSSSYWGSSSSDGGPSSERYGGGGRSNHGGRLREETKRGAKSASAQQRIGKLWVTVEWLVCISETDLCMQTKDNEVPELIASLFSSPGILNSLWVWRQRVCGESGGVKGTRE